MAKFHVIHFNLCLQKKEKEKNPHAASYRGCLVAAATLFTFGYLWLDLNDVCVG